MPTYLPKLVSIKKDSKKVSFNSLRPISPARKRFINEGLEFHIKRAKAETDQTSLKSYIVEATANLNKPTSFMWLKQFLMPTAKRMQQWQLYTYKNAPSWIVHEYESFWKEVLNEYSKALNNVNKSIIDVLGGKLAQIRPNWTAKPNSGVLVRKSMSSQDVGYTYTMAKDDTCNDNEFYLIHPQNNKRYKVKAGKHNITQDSLIEKSYAPKLESKHPDARWITITDEQSPLNLKSILISPNISGEAKILWFP